MRMICIDDEELVLELIVSLCRELPQNPEVKGFSRTAQALEFLEGNSVDIALLDINMPDMDGLTLAALIRETSPETAIIFLTGYEQYAVDAFSLHVSGYLLKPVSFERLSAEVDHALAGRQRNKTEHQITVKTFGEFEILVDGQAVAFSRTKSKELLAYLIDRHGGSVTRAVAFAALFEEKPYDRSGQKYLDVIIRSLRNTLEEAGAADILQLQRGSLRICPEKIDCDLYRFLNGEISAINSYRGEYMNAYSWASITEALTDRMAAKGGT